MRYLANSTDLVQHNMNLVNRSVLTPHEIRLLQLLADGYSVPALAAELGVTVSAVTFHLRRIFAKLGVHSKTTAVAAAFRLGLIE